MTKIPTERDLFDALISVRPTIRRLAAQCFDRDEAESGAWLAIAERWQDFDPSRGVSFPAFLVTLAKQGMRPRGGRDVNGLTPDTVRRYFAVMENAHGDLHAALDLVRAGGVALSLETFTAAHNAYGTPEAPRTLAQAQGRVRGYLFESGDFVDIAEHKALYAPPRENAPTGYGSGGFMPDGTPSRVVARIARHEDRRPYPFAVTCPVCDVGSYGAENRAEALRCAVYAANLVARRVARARAASRLPAQRSSSVERVECVARVLV